MKVSIIVPVYNSAQFLKKNISSILNQTYIDIEVILVNDGSQDNSVDIIKQYMDVDNRIVLLDKKNEGLVSAWQAGLKIASGDFVSFIDADDYVLPAYIERMVTIVEKYDVDMVMVNFFYDCSMINKKNQPHYNNIEPGLYNGDLMHEIHRSIFPKFGHYISPSRWAKLIRKNLILKNIKYASTKLYSAEDVAIILPVIFDCKSFYYVDEPLLAYVKRPTSISNVYRPIVFESTSIVLAQKEKGLDYKRETKGLYNFYGLLNSIYLSNSNLSFRNKKSELKKIITRKEYQEVLNLITIKDGVTALAYKYSSKFKMPVLLFVFFKLNKIIHKLW